MNIEIEIYRARIGIFSGSHKKCKHQVRSTQKLRNNSKLGSNKIFLTFKLTTIVLILLIVSGNVDVNPGPQTAEDSTSTSSVSSTSSKRSITHNDTLRVIHFNIQSLRYKVADLDLEVKDYDVVCLSETWLNENISETSLCMKGFHPPLRKDRDNSYGGVALYIRDHFKIKHRPDLDIHDLESVWAEIIYKSSKFLVGSMYRKPSSHVDYWDKVESCLEQVKLTGIQKIILAGDLNCNQLIPNNKLSKLFEEFHLQQLITVPTHVNSCIDVIATSCPDLVKYSGVKGPMFGSWHCPVEASFKMKIQKRKYYKREIWQYQLADWEKLNEHLENKDWSEVYAKTTVDQQCETWTKLYTQSLKQFIPCKTISINPNEAPWMKHEIKLLMRKKERAYKKARRTNKEKDHEKYRKFRNETVTKIREAKEEYDSNLAKKLNKNENRDTKLWWKIVKGFYNRHSANIINNPPIENENCNSIAYTDQEKAKIFNDFFASQSILDTRGARSRRNQ